MKNKLFGFTGRHPLWVVFIGLLFVFIAASGAKNLAFKSDYQVFFGKENPQLVAYESMQNIYNKSDSVSFVVVPAKGDVFTIEHLQALKDLTEQGWQVPYSSRVDSVSNFQYTFAEGDDMIVEDLVMDATSLSSADLDRIRSIASTMGIAGWLGFYLTGPSSSAPTMIMTLAVADCIHILTSMFYEMRHGSDKETAIEKSLKLNLQPIFLTSITTAVGFLSMNFSDSPPFRDLGNLVAMGVMFAFLFSVTIFPALLSILPIRTKLNKASDNDPMTSIARFVITRRRLLLPLLSGIIILTTLFIPNNELNDNFVEYFDDSVAYRVSTDFMQENLSGMTLLEISVEAGESNGVNNPAYLHALDAFSEWLRLQPETDHVNSITDTLKRLNKNMHGDNPNWYKLPTNKEMAAQYLLLYEMSLPYGLDLNNQLNVDKSSTKIVGTFKNLTSNEMITLEERVNNWFATNAKQYNVVVASPSLMFAHIGQRSINSMLIGTTAALVIISLMLGFALRSWKFGVISLLPNLIPAGVAFGVWGLVDGQIGLSLSVVIGMTLGIVVDDTVHFLSKYLHARRDREATPEAAVTYAFGHVGSALWITTLVLVAGFAVLAQSSFSLNADMGLLTAITIFIALIVDFLFLPPLLMAIERKVGSTETFAGSLNEPSLSQ